jgi:hypothetical protein
MSLSDHFLALLGFELMTFQTTVLIMISGLIFSALVLMSLRQSISDSYYDYVTTIFAHAMIGFAILVAIFDINFLSLINATYSINGLIFFITLLGLQHVVVKYVIPCVDRSSKRYMKNKRDAKRHYK